MPILDLMPRFHGSGPGVKLMKNPNDLFPVWKEWEFGLNGTKPAKDFISHERGANKFTYCRRKVFWDAFNPFIARGIQQILLLTGFMIRMVEDSLFVKY